MDMGNGDFYIKNTDGVDFKLDLNKNDFPTGVKESIVAGCFLGETKVKTEYGFVAIRDIEEGNKVLTVNEETGQEEYKEVKKVFIRSGNEICIIKAGNDIIKATTGHLFKVKDKWWTAAINIEKGDYISTDDNKYLQVDEVSLEKNNYPSFVYNLSVEENHNYFVGEEKILAHNMANMKSCTQDIKGIGNSNELLRGDSALYSDTRPNGIRKSYVSNEGNLVPANIDGTYKGRQVTVTEHILGGYRKGAKGNSPYTSFTFNRDIVTGYGDNLIEVDISGLRKAIQSGDVHNVAILSPKQIERLIKNDKIQSGFWKKRALSWTKRDSEYLIRGEIPSQFIKINK